MLAPAYVPTQEYAVSSAMKGLTSGFGMGPGVPPSLWEPTNSNPGRELLHSAFEAAAELPGLRIYSSQEAYASWLCKNPQLGYGLALRCNVWLRCRAWPYTCQL